MPSSPSCERPFSSRPGHASLPVTLAESSWSRMVEVPAEPQCAPAQEEHEQEAEPCHAAQTNGGGNDARDECAHERGGRINVLVEHRWHALRHEVAQDAAAHGRDDAQEHGEQVWIRAVPLASPVSMPVTVKDARPTVSQKL